MLVLDTCGWIEWLAGGPLSRIYTPLIVGRPHDVLVPTIVVYELTRWTERERGEASALDLLCTQRDSRVLPLTEAVAVLAARLAAQWRLHTADAIVLAHARTEGTDLVTSDAALGRVPGVTFHPK
jgi:predicted nucleic acid-binding protein